MSANELTIEKQKGVKTIFLIFFFFYNNANFRIHWNSRDNDWYKNSLGMFSSKL